MSCLDAHAHARARTLQCVEQEAQEAKAGAIRAHLRGLAQERDSALLSKQLQEQGASEEKQVTGLHESTLAWLSIARARDLQSASALKCPVQGIFIFMYIHARTV